MNVKDIYKKDKNFNFGYSTKEQVKSSRKCSRDYELKEIKKKKKIED